MREISYFVNKQSENARINMYSNKNARKKWEGKPAPEITMCALSITFRAITPIATDNVRNSILR